MTMMQKEFSVLQGLMITRRQGLDEESGRPTPM
jgi:hypothetical protein